MRSPLDWATGSWVRIGVVMGAGLACAGAFLALVAGWGVVWIGIGILAGVLLGGFIALFGGRLTSRRSGLTVEQGWEVNRAILRGEMEYGTVKYDGVSPSGDSSVGVARWDGAEGPATLTPPWSSTCPVHQGSA